MGRGEGVPIPFTFVKWGWFTFVKRKFFLKVKAVGSFTIADKKINRKQKYNNLTSIKNIQLKHISNYTLSLAGVNNV